jgi:tRNA dimethylallyltransferase
MFREPPLERERVAALRAHLASFPVETLAEWVRVLDPPRARVARAGGARRMIRTLEVTLLSGRPLSWWHGRGAPDAPALEGPIVVLELPAEELDRRIDQRVDRMLAAGLVGEVRALLAAGYGPDDPGLTGVGYREVVGHLRDGWSLDRTRDAIRRRTRRYARRQLTWLRNQLPDVGVLRLDATSPEPRLVEAIVDTWRRARERAVRGGGAR